MTLQQKLEETYQHLLPYLKNDDDLKKTCALCENYMGNDHEYSECRNNQCFVNYLGLKCLKWEMSFKGGE